MNKRFGVIGFFGGMMQVRLRHTDSELAAQVANYCYKNRIAHTIHCCKNGTEFIEVICDEYTLTQLRKLTIRKQIVRLENKYNNL